VVKPGILSEEFPRAVARLSKGIKRIAKQKNISDFWSVFQKVRPEDNVGFDCAEHVKSQVLDT
jgi:hypothetical protein